MADEIPEKVDALPDLTPEERSMVWRVGQEVLLPLGAVAVYLDWSRRRAKIANLMIPAGTTPKADKPKKHNGTR